MKKRNRLIRGVAAATMVAAVGMATSSVAQAATPTVAVDDGAFVRLLGNPAEGTAKFQFGWSDSTLASDEAAGYWVGLYDVTNSQYVWSGDTGPIDTPDRLLRNAKPTEYLPNGEYKVVFFVRDAYEPATNVAEIELPFTVDNSMM